MMDLVKFMTVKAKKFTTFWLPPTIWAVVIFSFSSRPVQTTSEVYWQDFVVKKTAHLIEYAILAILLYRALKESGLSRKRSGIYSIVVVFIYGALDEFHQSFTPGRQSRIRDVIIDTVGGSLGIYALWNLLPKAPKNFKDLLKKLHLE
jgi:VanZ family protein